MSLQRTPAHRVHFPLILRSGPAFQNARLAIADSQRCLPANKKCAPRSCGLTRSCNEYRRIRECPFCSRAPQNRAIARAILIAYGSGGTSATPSSLTARRISADGRPRSTGSKHQIMAVGRAWASPNFLDSFETVILATAFHQDQSEGFLPLPVASRPILLELISVFALNSDFPPFSHHPTLPIGFTSRSAARRVRAVCRPTTKTSRPRKSSGGVDSLRLRFTFVSHPRRAVKRELLTRPSSLSTQIFPLMHLHSLCGDGQQPRTVPPVFSRQSKYRCLGKTARSSIAAFYRDSRPR